MKFRSIFSLVLIALVSCSSSSSIRIDVDIASNQTVNPLKTVQNDLDASLSDGIHFVFDLLNCPPATISDTAQLEEFAQPPLTEAGSSALNNTFNINTSDLVERAYYRVRMIARDLGGNITHIGTSDCPISMALSGDLNEATICFGVNQATPPLCADTIPFDECPSVQPAAVAQVCP